MTNRYLHHFVCFQASLVLFLFFAALQAFSQTAGTGRTGMLILGSANSDILKERVNVGAKLYGSGIAFDYIIVSGGCAAHGSNICEATRMKALLQEKGVPAAMIFKDEKAKTTVQNYCYSRTLKKADGSRIIHEGDTLYVVSSHWHAIPVAACFTKKDLVTALHHIEGAIRPDQDDKVDYSDIYQDCSASDYYCRSALWPLVDASYYDETSGTASVNYVIDDIFYQGPAAATGEFQAGWLAEATIKLPDGWSEEIDAAYYNNRENKVYYFKGQQYLRFSPKAKTIDAGYPKAIEDWVRGLPGQWHSGYIDAAFFEPSSGKVYLFKGSQYLQVSARSGKIGKGYPKKIHELAADWPFSWSNGDIDAASYDHKNKQLYLFRGQDHVQISMEGPMKIAPGYPKRTKIAWPEDLWGKRP